MITPEIVEEFKERMHITHAAEDSNLMRMLSFSAEYVKDRCGEFTFENQRAKELVFERSRFAYNDALEYFEDSFLSEIHALGFTLAAEEGADDATTV